MLNQLDFQKLQLGEDSAEQDIRAGLRDYFVENTSYSNLLRGNKFIVVGNRGAGKSAIFKYLADKEFNAGSVVLELTPEEYSYDLLSSILRKESNGNWGKQSSYSISWQYLIHALIFKELVSRNKGLVTGANKAIYDFVRDNFKENDISPLGIFVSYLKRIEGAKFGEYEIGIKKKDIYKLYELQEIRELQPYFMKILDKIRVRVFIDELDKGWDNSEDAQYFLAGLLQAVQKLNNIHKNLKVYVSIRQELFDNIPQIYEDAQKIRGNIETIRWDADGLLEFITMRMKHSFPHLANNNQHEVWSCFFQEVLEYRQTKSFNYMIDRTQLRPREFLQFTKACINQVLPDSRLVTYNDISKAQLQYSESKTKDLASEYRFQYPGLLDIFSAFRGKSYSFEKDELDLFLLSFCEGEITLKSAIWVKEIEYFELKKILWEIGFIKAWIVGGLKSGRKSGSSYLGHYELSSINIEGISRFQIHSAFWAYLNLKEKKGTA